MKFKGQIVVYPCKKLRVDENYLGGSCGGIEWVDLAAIIILGSVGHVNDSYMHYYGCDLNVIGFEL